MHILVKWPRLNSLDVYSVDCLLDVGVGLNLINDPGCVNDLKGRKFLIKWCAEAEPEEAYIVAAGAPEALEKKRTKVLKAFEVVTDICGHQDEASCAECPGHKRKIEELEDKNAHLSRKLEKAKRKSEISSVVEQMENIIESAKQASTIATASKVDIGLGVLVEAGVLHRIERAAKGDGKRLARSLMRVVFALEEMKGHTLYGIKCNAQKDVPVKPALDETRREAVLVAAIMMTTFS